MSNPTNVQIFILVMAFLKVVIIALFGYNVHKTEKTFRELQDSIYEKSRKEREERNKRKEAQSG